MTYRTYRTHATYTPARLLLLLWLILDSSAREPIPAPPKVETQTKTVRARDLAIPFDGIPGKFNAITDVPGVEVGYTTLISGEGKLEVGKGPVRTGGPVAEGFAWRLPLVAETWDGWLNDVDGFHVRPEHVAHAIESVHSGAIEEWSVGGGTGIICYEFKGGTGTASRVVSVAGIGDPGSSASPHPFIIGVLVQANCGRRPQLTIRGLEVGKKILGSVYKRETGSIIIVVATDAPLLPHQLKRLARRASLGLARTGSVS